MSELIHRKDYRAPNYWVDEIELTLALDPAATIVTSRLSLKSNTGGPLILDGGKEVELVSIKAGNQDLTPADYRHQDGQLIIETLGEQTILEIVTRIAPQKNTALEGLYVSDGIFCTQCEAEGFRRITFYPDRPDVMARFRVRLEGDKQREPILLAGGNPVATGDLPNGRHYAVFDDPFPKPCYLFAVVGGDLDWIEDTFTTMSGRTVTLKIFVNKGNADKAHHAMRSLKASMAWDEKTYGREYQLDVFNIVAVHNFNMGAMENTGLNIFNAKYVLADSQTATDADFANVEGVIAHEYFHNWTGNRVTVRDWFQLSLKEGLTVFRDQEFSADQNNRIVKRVQDVDRLRRAQFPEDAGPTAHPIRPDSYVEINNFYTATVYEKGAEVVRMMHTLLGPERYRAGTDLYFQRHDGQAVTCEDFVKALEDASGIDLTQFRLWYSQAGTPEVKASGVYDADAQTYVLTLEQTIPATPGQPVKSTAHMPVAIGLIDPAGEDMVLRLQGEEKQGGKTRILDFTAAVQDFTFVDIPKAPIPSVFRGFSAPIKLEMSRPAYELQFLMQHDSDGFNRVMAARDLATQALKTLLDQAQQGKTPTLDASYTEAVRNILRNPELEPALVSEMLSLPAKSIFAQDFTTIDVEGITTAYQAARLHLAEALHEEWQAAYQVNHGAIPYDAGGSEIAKRSLKNLSLSYMTALKSNESLAVAERQYHIADNMTDRIAALALLIRDGGTRGDIVLKDFYQIYRDDVLVIDKWFMLQAMVELPGRLGIIKTLTQHPDFTFSTPNRVYALIGAFTGPVSPSFHAESGEGYSFLREIVEILDRTNPQVAARMVSPLLQWRRYNTMRQDKMRHELGILSSLSKLSKNVSELVGKSLEGPVS